MTLQQFLEALEQTPRDWMFVGDTRRIRRPPPKNPGPQDIKCGTCPLTEVAGYPGTVQFMQAGRELGFDVETTQRISDAGDGYSWRDENLRVQLEIACGLRRR